MAHTVKIINGKQPSGGVGGVSDADLSNIANNFLTKGVVKTDDYKVEQQATPNMTVKVNTGEAYVPNPAGTMLYDTALDASVNATIGANASGNPRIDAVVIKIDLGTTPNNFANNVASIAVVPGTPAASPSAPSDSAIQTAVGGSNPFLRIANVTVDNGATSITNAKIASARSRVQLKNVSSGEDGWTADGGTWVYASANSFTISGDQTARLKKGTKVKYTQGGNVKYGVLSEDSSYGTPNTTVSLAANDDFDVANSAISDPYYSYQESPQGYPSFFNLSSTLTGFSGTPTVNLLIFTVRGGMCTVIYDFFGTSNSAAMNMAAPVECAAVAGSVNQLCGVIDNGTDQSSPGLVGIPNTAPDTIKFGKTYPTRAGNAYGGFTASGVKGAEGVLTYPI